MKRAAILFLAVASALFAGCKSEAPLPPGAAQPIKFQLLQMTTCEDDGTAVFPAKLEKLDGKRVSVSGFMTPYDNPEEMNKLLLTKDSSSCFYCNPPQASGVLFVRLSSDATRPSAESGTVTFEGTIHLVGRDCEDKEAKQFCFTLDDARITKLTPAPEVGR